ncbi:ATP-dependent DNA helicase RecQ [Fodinibius salinus]|uniref:DNA helicase RecQ n=1 Tax=Fodinibius salinus TaxID=860790 RepID=A0A5D3YKZ7_9BACT|nr:DNA helicase RecQ [Fodinibius salinus]TYP93327.1 ATP-dependent DNA helicase RecQ [Fodinibius salinus]
MIKEAHNKLTNVFGFEDFRPLQEEVISQVLDKKDALVIMPTGGGKSLCYQIPALLFDGLTIVVSPLISLMKDQVEQLRQYDIPAIFLNSTLTPEEYEENVQKIKDGDVKMVYMAPETLMMDKTRELLSNQQIDLFTIDEAHCISEWGHDFRPDYRALTEVREDFPEAVCLALTATATPRVREDIKDILNFGKSETFLASFDRKNLFLKVADKEDPLEQTLDFLYTRKKQSGIIYCFSRKQVEELYVELKKEGHSVKPYHAGLSKKLRNKNQEAFIRDDIQIIVATIAFGMGIDKPNVRFVMHYDLPKNIESYYQQIGRAGRDGLRADCLVLYNRSDKRKIQYFINQKEGTEKRVAEKHLKEMLKFMETDECRRVPLMGYFGETYENDNCGMCDNCLSIDAEVEDLTVQAQKFMSCVARTNEEYGPYYIADILRGSTKKEVLENGHDELSTYNVGNEWAKEHWILLGRMLVKQEYLSQQESRGPLILTDQAKAVLNGKENVFGALDRSDTVVGDEAIERTSSEVQNNFEEDLFEQLEIKRKELADEQAVPPYVIFPDTTLMEMSYYLPQSTDHLMPIYGMGTVKKKKYGMDFLKIIRNYCEEHNLEEREKTLKKKKKALSEKDKHQRIGEHFNNGKSIAHLAEQYGVKKVTIIKHLKTYLENGNELRPEGIVEASSLSTRKRNKVLEVFDDIAPHMLRPIYNKLDKSVGYDELRIIQLYYMAQQK